MTIDSIDQDGLKLAAESGSRYLGSLRVVDRIVRAFAAGVASEYSGWTSGGDDPTAIVEEQCQRMGDLFLGRDLQGFEPQPWNSEKRLGTQLRVALSCAPKDPGFALFEQLALCVLASCINHGNGEAEETARETLEGQIRQTVAALLGAPETV
jgi:hypothetical protein